jgi:hypothetical protein
LLLRTIPLPKAGRRHASDPAKSARKIVLVLKSQVEAYVQNTEVRVPKQLARTRNSAMENVLVGAESGRFLEQRSKIINAQIQILRKFREGDALIEVSVHIFEDAFQALRRQAGIPD